MSGVDHRIRWQPGTRRAAAPTITPHAARPRAARGRRSSRILTFQMRGLGLSSSPSGATACGRASEAVGGDVWTLADLDPLEPRHLHVQQLCRARIGRPRKALGVLEQLVIGPHAPSGFRSIIDGAPPGVRQTGQDRELRPDAFAATAGRSPNESWPV